MSDQLPPSSVLAFANDLLEKHSTTPAPGCDLECFVLCRGVPCMYHLSTYSESSVLKDAIAAYLRTTEAALTGALNQSGFAQSHMPFGFEHVTFLCDDNAEPCLPEAAKWLAVETQFMAEAKKTIRNKFSMGVAREFHLNDTGVQG